MRVLFFATHPYYIYECSRGFEKLGHKVESCSIKGNKNIPELIKEFKPHLIITMGRGEEQRKQNQNIMKEYIKGSKAPHVYWATEDPIRTSNFSLPLIKTMEPDFVFTISKEKVDYYNNQGIRSDYLPFGYEPSIHFKTKKSIKYSKPIAVVANGYPWTLRKAPQLYRHESIKTLVSPLIKENIRVDLWGRHWKIMKPFVGYDIPHDWIHGPLSYSKANKVYSSSDIIIGLQNFTTQLTRRTYQILASGGFLLTSDTPEVRSIFVPGRDLIVSSSPEETIELINYYLKKTEEREKIIKNGKIAVQNHSYKHRAEYIIDVLKKEGILPKNLE